MKKEVSAGILLQYGDKYLIVRATPNELNGFNSSTWGIPKGHVDEGEDLLSTSIRETYEEIGIDFSHLRDKITPLTSYTTKAGKTVHVFHLILDEIIPTIKMDCNTYLDNGVPEIDRWVWVTKQEAMNTIKNRSKQIFKMV